MNRRAMKTCWEAAFAMRRGTPLGMGRVFWLRRCLYYLFVKETI